jgi:hypothetical protein
MDLRDTKEQQLVFLNVHWGRRYLFAAPDSPGGEWAATANFGQHHQLQKPSAAELLLAVRRHYSAKRPEDE